jgi:hypothetical protein
LFGGVKHCIDFNFSSDEDLLFSQNIFCVPDFDKKEFLIQKIYHFWSLILSEKLYLKIYQSNVKSFTSGKYVQLHWHRWHVRKFSRGMLSKIASSRVIDQLQS